jgi:F0F1-type ATP synthase assembly protein I
VQNKKKGFVHSFRALAQIGNFGFTMAAAILLGYYLGSYLDQKFGTTPWLMLVLLILFIVGAFIKFLQSTRELNKTDIKK